MPTIERGLNKLGGRCWAVRAAVPVPCLLAAGFTTFSVADSSAVVAFPVRVVVLPRVARAMRAFAISLSFDGVSCSLFPTVEKKPGSRRLGVGGGSTSATGSAAGVSCTGSCCSVAGVTRVGRLRGERAGRLGLVLFVLKSWLMPGLLGDLN